MGVFTDGGDEHVKNAMDDHNSIAGTGKESDEGYPTDVEGVNADDIVKYGKEEYPAFEVSPQEFFSNQKADRKKLRFKNGSKAGEYMRKTRNGARPFYIKTTAADGTKYTRKIR